MSEAMTAVKLEPCPFDGAPAVFRWCGGVYLAECTKCGCSKSGQGISWEEDQTMDYAQRQAALEARAAEVWNIRSQRPALSDAKAIRRYYTTAVTMGFVNAPMWDELAEETKDMYRT